MPRSQGAFLLSLSMRADKSLASIEEIFGVVFLLSLLGKFLLGDERAVAGAGAT